MSLVRFGASFLVILTTGVLNRLLMVEAGLAAGLVTVILSFQHLTSPLALWSGWLSDRIALVGKRRVPWIRFWTLLSAALVPFMPTVAYGMNRGPLWIAGGALLFGVFGFGLKAANLLVGSLIVDRTTDLDTRGRQLNVIWIMAIAGFVVAGYLFRALLPDLHDGAVALRSRLDLACWVTATIAVVLAWVGTWGVETSDPTGTRLLPGSFRKIFADLVMNAATRRLFLFLVIADFSFFVQEFVLESFGGEVFQLPPSVTTSFNITFGLGMLLAMIASGIVGTIFVGVPTRRVLAFSCLLGALSFGGLSLAALGGAAPVLTTAVFVLGVSKGLYNVGLSFLFTGLSRTENAGVVMGAWGAVGGFAVALGGLSGGVIKSAAQGVVVAPDAAYAVVFGIEVVGMVGAWVIVRTGRGVGE